MKSVRRALVSISIVAALVGGPAAAVSAETSEDEVVSVQSSTCPSGYTGVILDFYVGNPPQHVYTLRLCQNILPN